MSTCSFKQHLLRLRCRPQNLWHQEVVFEPSDFSSMWFVNLSGKDHQRSSNSQTAQLGKKFTPRPVHPATNSLVQFGASSIFQPWDTHQFTHSLLHLQGSAGELLHCSNRKLRTQNCSWIKTDNSWDSLRGNVSIHIFPQTEQHWTASLARLSPYQLPTLPWFEFPADRSAIGMLNVFECHSVAQKALRIVLATCIRAKGIITQNSPKMTLQVMSS